MSEAISPEQLPQWVPGDLTVDSSRLGWEGMRVRGYRYGPLDVPVPALQDYMIVVYGCGATPMSRRCDSRWTDEKVVPGNVSLLTHQVNSHWRWTQDIEVAHLYLSPRQLARVGAEVFERDVASIELSDVLKADDPALAQMVWHLANEARGPGLGGRLFADAVMNQACVHILRNYAHVEFVQREHRGELSRRQKKRLVEYMHCHLAGNIPLQALADIAGLSVYCFARKFRESFGEPPHEFLTSLRVERARELLADGSLPIKAIAANCGFADQSHMTRVFRKKLGPTPGQYRRQS